MSIDWQPLETAPDGGRILIFSPIYTNEQDPMRYRVIDAQFLKISKEATHWSPLNPPE